MKEFSPFLAVLVLIAMVGAARAGVSVSGDVDPVDPNTWDSNTYAYIGRDANGTLSITSGSEVSDYRGYIGYESGSAGTVTVDGAGSTWTNSSGVYVGNLGIGTLNITGGVVTSQFGLIGSKAGSTGKVTVTGVGSTWTCSVDPPLDGSPPPLDSPLAIGRGTLSITAGGTVNSGSGYVGGPTDSTGEATVEGSGSIWTVDGFLFVGGQSNSNGTLSITAGGAVIAEYAAHIGFESGSTGEVTVTGVGSTWTNNNRLFVGSAGSGTLNITGGGLVSIGETLTIDDDGAGDGFVNMATGGMLALFGDADGSLVDFLGLVNGTDAIRYWDDSISDWADLTGATYGDDYTLSYLTKKGDLVGYTVLTVTAIPEPVTLSLLALGGLAPIRRRK